MASLTSTPRLCSPSAAMNREIKEMSHSASEGTNQLWVTEEPWGETLAST